MMHVSHKLTLQATWPKGRKMCTGAKKLRFIFFDILFNLFNLYLIFYFSGKGIKPDLNYSVTSFNFSIQSRLYSLASLFVTSKERCNLCIIYAWIVHRWIVNRWIVYREIAQPLKDLFSPKLNLNSSIF